jgi:serine/threonine-protein kinase HipA
VNGCLSCLGPLEGREAESGYHEACLTRLFGQPGVPRISFDALEFPARVAKSAGKMSISGHQPKAVVDLSADGSELVIVPRGGRFILKPQHGHHPHVPENEHLTMCLAALAGIEVPPLALLRLADGSLAYLIRRFDRTGEGGRDKVHVVDFCQILGRPSSQKQSGSAEECARALAGIAVERGSALRALFTRFLFSYWVGNGDMHLKNLAVLDEGGYRLAPAFDILNTWIYRDRTQTLSVGGRERDLRRQHFITLGREACGMTREDVERGIDDLLAKLDQASVLLGASPLVRGLGDSYRRLLEKRTRSLRFVAGLDAEEEEEEED